LNCRQSTKANPLGRQKTVGKNERERGNKSESDLGSKTGNSLDALLHSRFHYLRSTKAMSKAEAATALCKNRRREKRSEKKAFFIDEQRKLYLLPLVQNGSHNTLLCYVLFFFFCYNLRSSIVKIWKWKKRKKNRRNSKRESRKRNEKNSFSIAVPITIITWSIACIRFRLGKHVFKDKYQG
jgi:hypothetical protein